MSINIFSVFVLEKYFRGIKEIAFCLHQKSFFSNFTPPRFIRGCFEEFLKKQEMQLGMENVWTCDAKRKEPFETFISFLRPLSGDESRFSTQL